VSIDTRTSLRAPRRRARHGELLVGCDRRGTGFACRLAPDVDYICNPQPPSGARGATAGLEVKVDTAVGENEIGCDVQHAIHEGEHISSVEVSDASYLARAPWLLPSPRVRAETALGTAEVTVTVPGLALHLALTCTKVLGLDDHE